MSNVKKIYWFRGVWNGLLALILGFICYMVPSLIKSLGMGFKMGRQGIGSVEISERISTSMSLFYESALWLFFLFVIFTGIFIVLRAMRMVKKNPGIHPATGFVMASVPIIVFVLFGLWAGSVWGFIWSTIILLFGAWGASLIFSDRSKSSKPDADVS